jgi:hypothetical protein
MPTNLPANGCLSRRHLLAKSGFCLSSLGALSLLQREGLLAKPVDLVPRHFDTLPKPPEARPKARAMISLFMQGGPSQIDLFDPKPELEKRNGQKFSGDIKFDDSANASTTLMASPWKFKQHGHSGTAVSELLPYFSQIVDDVLLIRGMQTGVSNHGQGIYAMQTGGILAGRPTLGSWLTYALGSETSELPAYVALTDPRGLPVLGVANWTQGWLPSIYQGTAVRSQEPRMPNLDPAPHLRGEAQKRYLDFLGQLNGDHLQRHPGESDLEARIASYALAGKLQLAAKEALDISGESAATKKLYGIDEPATAEFGTRCLIARRLVERGVRFVQLFTGNQTWDHHKGILAGLPAACKYVDKGSAALVIDLKARGLLDSTVVHWGGEMGRLPVIEYPGSKEVAGRDHNTYGFSMWMAGGGFKAGATYGETDEFGHKAVTDIVTHHDYHATLLHLFGLEHEKLTFHRNGSPMSLTDNKGGKIIPGLLA